MNVNSTAQFSLPKGLSLTQNIFAKVFLSQALLAVFLIFLGLPAQAKQAKQYSLSLVDKPKYAPNFKHFDYVNPNAPKGGRAKRGKIGSFDSFNLFLIKGEIESGVGMIYDTLMKTSFDEPSSIYPNLAEYVTIAKDYSSVSYTLRKEARWHDGKPITPEDVIFSLATFRKHHPSYGQYYKNVKSVKKTGSRTVTFYFAIKNNKELPYILGELRILPKHYWTGKKADGTPRDPSKTTLEPPLGSGPYKISKVNNGKSITYARVKDYWGAKLPVNVGHYNFDTISYDYYRDSTANLEAFKAGQLDFRLENSSKQWATGYNFPALKKGLVAKELMPLKEGQGMQGFVMNLRRKQFKDPKVREAFTLAFNFEWANKNLFYGQYTRTSSYFQNSDLAAKGLPEGQELEILKSLKGKIPERVFTTAYAPPKNDTPKALRSNLIKARNLLKEAGWKIKQEVDKNASCGLLCKIGLSSQAKKKILRNAKGDVLHVEFLLISPSFKRVVLPYIQNLNKLGITARIRLVDNAQYTGLLNTFDYDIIVSNWGQSESPGNEQRNYWGSAAADQKGSRNAIGIKNPAIDSLIDKIIFAKDRKTLVATTRALDRVLLWNHYLVPQWHLSGSRIAYWKRFGRPEKMPSRSVGFPNIWWYDEKKAASLGK